MWRILTNCYQLFLGWGGKVRRATGLFSVRGLQNMSQPIREQGKTCRFERILFLFFWCLSYFGSSLCNIRQFREAHGINTAVFLTSLQASPAKPRLPVLKVTTASTCTNSRFRTPSTCANPRLRTPSTCTSSRPHTAKTSDLVSIQIDVSFQYFLLYHFCSQLYFCADLKRKGTCLVCFDFCYKIILNSLSFSKFYCLYTFNVMSKSSVFYNFMFLSLVWLGSASLAAAEILYM